MSIVSASVLAVKPSMTSSGAINPSLLPTAMTNVFSPCCIRSLPTEPVADSRCWMHKPLLPAHLPYYGCYMYSAHPWSYTHWLQSKSLPPIPLPCSLLRVGLCCRVHPRVWLCRMATWASMAACPPVALPTRGAHAPTLT